LLAHFKEIDMVDQNLRPAPAVSLFQFLTLLENGIAADDFFMALEIGKSQK
jgi:hypothetical protein